MHDNRACGLITRVLRSFVSAFTGSDSVIAEIREFISTEVFKACITSLHDPYFVDTQYDLAQLIASIIKRYIPLTETPRRLLCSLPGMDQAEVDEAIKRIIKVEGNNRQQRAIVLKLLEGLRGGSVSEQGRYPKADVKKAKSAIQERYTTAEPQTKTAREQSPDLVGVAAMFA